MEGMKGKERKCDLRGGNGDEDTYYERKGREMDWSGMEWSGVGMWKE